ncbi:MAG: penicillin-binding transpeptidase domain-containing protein, partial [Planctomycetota bacterium]
FDELLRGRFGVECIERDHMNRRQRELATAPATPGRDLVLTIDSRLQKIVEDQMAHALYRDGRRAVGAAVFMDVRNGHVLAVASSPAYDPACFRDVHAYRRVVQDPDRPLFNRALRGRLPLGSVFKVVTALAALEHGTVPAGVDCTGRVRCGRRYFRCHRAHGHVDLREGIQRSCNSFFYITARKTGDRALIEMARRLGFGRKTGLRFPDEASGNVPVRAPGGQLLNLAIGQGELVVTPLQVARMMAAVANGGTLVPPRLVRELRPFQSDGGGEPPADPRPPVDLDLSDASLAAVGDGLYRVVNEPGGTGRRAFAHWSRPFQVCGKTSTAQRTVRRDGEVTADNVGWFAGYAPHKTPRVAFAVAVERLSGGQSGGRTAGPIARDILERIPLDLLGLGAGGGAEP